MKKIGVIFILMFIVLCLSITTIRAPSNILNPNPDSHSVSGNLPDGKPNFQQLCCTCKPLFGGYMQQTLQQY